MISRALALLSVVALSFLAVSASEISGIPHSEKLKQLGFLNGTWVALEAKEGGAKSVTEETWSTVAGDSMVGYCRAQKAGATNFLELIEILDGPKGVVMRIRHFNEMLVGWPDDEEAGDLNLIKLEKDFAVFQNQKSKRVTITYKRMGKTLECNVDIDDNGQKKTYPFTYHLRRNRLATVLF